MLSKQRTNFFARLALAIALLLLVSSVFQTTHRHNVGEHSGNWESGCSFCQYGNVLTAAVVAAPVKLFHGPFFVVSLFAALVTFVATSRSSAFARAPPSWL